jgi:hypothetical protein
VNKNVTWITEAVPIHAENQEAVGKTVDGLTVPHAAKATNAANAAKAGNLNLGVSGFGGGSTHLPYAMRMIAAG